MTRPASTSLRTRRARLLSAAAAGALTSALVWASPASAAPGSATVQTGTATVGVSPTNSKETDVTQTSQRAFIDWTSFNLSADEIVAFKQALGASSITFNRVSSDAGLTTIAGQITAPGAVWLFTPAGLIVGPTAKINVGALVASTGEVTPNFGFGPSGAGTFAPLSDNAVPIFGATAAIQVQSGAQITASSGFVVLNSQQVTQNGQVTATDAVSFDLANNSTINFTTGNTTGAVQQLGTVNVSGADSANASLTHGGTSKGAWVQVAAPDEGSDDSGFAGVINMSGVMQATGVAPAGTAQNSVLLVGADAVAGPIEGGNRSFSLKAGSGTMTADSGGIYFTGSDAALGTASAKGAVNIAVDNALTLGATSVLRADSSGVGSNALTIQAGSIVANASSVIAAGPVSGAPTSDVTINTDQGMTLGVVKGGDVELQANGGDIDLLGPTTASVLLNVQAPTGSVLVEANVSSQGSITINAGDTISASAGVTLQSNLNGLPKGGITLTAFDLNLDPTSSLLAGPDMAHLVGDVDAHGDNSAAVGKIAGAFVDVTSSGNITLGGDITSASSVDVWNSPDTVTVSGGVTVAAAGYIDIESASLISLGDGAVLQANTGGGGGDIYLESFAIDAAPTSLMAAGPLTGPGTDTVTAYADGGDLRIGKVVGTDVDLRAQGLSDAPGSGCEGDCGPPPPDSGGSAYLEGDVDATGAFTAISTFADVHLDANVTAGDSVTISALAGSILAGPAATIIGDANGGGLSMDLRALDIALDPASTLQGGATAAAPTADVKVTATNGDIATGAISGVNVELSTAGAVTVGGAIYGSTSVIIDPADVTLNASVTSGGGLDITADNSITLGDGVTVSAADHLNLTATTIAAGKGVTLQSDSDGDGNGDLTLVMQSVSGAPTLIAGKDATHPSAAITADASAGGLELGGVTGNLVSLTGEAGDVTLAGPSTTGTFLTITAIGGKVGLNGNIAGGGAVDVTADDAITLGAGVTISAADHLNLTATTITAGAGATLQSDSDGDGNGDLTLVMHSVSGGVSLIAGKDATHPSAAITADASAGGLDLGGVTGDVVHLTGEAGDVTLAGASTTGTSLTIRAVGGNIGLSGNVTGSGTIDLTADKVITVGAGAVVSAGDHLQATAASISLGAGGGVASDADQDGVGALSLHALTGDIVAGAGSLVNGGAAAVTVTSDAGAVTLSSASGSNLTITASKAVTLNGALSATGQIDASGQSIAVNGGMTALGIELDGTDAITVAANQTLKAGSSASLYGGAITLGAKSVVQGDTAGAGGGVLLGGSSISADASSQLLAGSSPTKLAGDISVFAAGDVILGQALGGQVTVSSSGDVTLAGAVQGVSGVSVDPGNLTIDATVSSGGAIYLATSGGVLTVGSGVAITSTGGQVELFSDGDLSVGANASVTGVSLLAQSNGVLHLASGASLVTTGQEAAPAWPVVSAPLTGGGEGPPVVSGLVIVASGLDLQGSITAGQAGARDDVYIVATGQPQQVVVGGADSASGFHLSNAAIGRITARNLVVMAGFGNGDGTDIAVQDLTLNTAQLGALALGTDSSHVIDVTGAVALQGTGSTDLHLGFALQTTTGGPTNNPDAPNGGAQTSRVGYVPSEIDISGSLGSAASPFHAAVLLARDDIFMGSADFITAAKADATFDAGKSSSAYAIDTGHVFLASHDLELAAEGRIIQQNTGGSLQFAGLVFDAPTSGHELVANPTSLNGQALQENDDGWTPDYATGPTRVDVFGLVTKADGTIVGSVDAAQVGNLSAPAIADVSHYKINTCVFATQCLTTPPPRIEVPTDEIIQAQAAADSSSASSTQTPTSFAQTIQIDDTSDDDKSANGAPVTGSGNGDLWTGPSTTAH